LGGVRDRSEARATVKEVKDTPVRIDKSVNNRIASVMPFNLTRATEKSHSADLQRHEIHCAMNRLLQGDVGSGKTIVAVVAMIAAMENDLQTALMAPTEILAEQHARSINACWRRHLIASSC
jgi:ATP-dependent DNA helicase RecG